MSKLIALAAAFVLTACTTTPQQPQTFVHPDWPTPVQPVNINWSAVASDDGKDVKVQMSLDDSIELRIFLEDIRRHTVEMRETLCFYRPDDVRCKTSKNTK